MHTCSQCITLCPSRSRSTCALLVRFTFRWTPNGLVNCASRGQACAATAQPDGPLYLFARVAYVRSGSI